MIGDATLRVSFDAATGAARGFAQGSTDFAGQSELLPESVVKINSAPGAGGGESCR
jgi:hypothetical protein